MTIKRKKKRQQKKVKNVCLDVMYICIHVCRKLKPRREVLLVRLQMTRCEDCNTQMEATHASPTRRTRTERENQNQASRKPEVVPPQDIGSLQDSEILNLHDKELLLILSSHIGSQHWTQCGKAGRIHTVNCSSVR